MANQVVLLLQDFVHDEEIDWESLDPNTSLVELGIIDSMDLTQVLLKIESISQKSIDYSELDFETAFSINGLENLLID